MDNLEIKKVAWNASEGLIMEISNRRSYANTFYINGDIKKAFKTLIAIKQSVTQSFTKIEREELEQKEKLFNKLSYALSYSNSGSFNKEVLNNYNEAKLLAIKFYAQYNDKLMDLLNDRGYLIGEASDASKMKF